MSLMSKLLMSTVAVTLTLSADAQPDNKILLQYVKRSVVKNPQVTVKGISVVERTTHKDLPGWTILLTNMDLEYQKREIHAPETIFLKDGIVTGHLVNLKTNVDYRDIIKPHVPQSMYDNAHLLFGSKDAAHKVLVFSDPMCPFCRETVPGIMKAAKEHPDKIALYYYHLPLLRIHPVSDILTRVMHIAQKEGKTDVIEKIYTLQIAAQETNMTKVLAAIKSHTGFSVSASTINDKEVRKAIKADEEAAGRMMVSGTPTVYIDGVWDQNRNGYKNLIK